MGTEIQKKESKVVSFLKGQKGTIIAVVIVIVFFMLFYQRPEPVIVKTEIEKEVTIATKKADNTQKDTKAVAVHQREKTEDAKRRCFWIDNKTGNNIYVYVLIPVENHPGEFREKFLGTLGENQVTYFVARKGNQLSFIAKRGLFRKNVYIGYKFFLKREVATATIFAGGHVNYLSGAPDFLKGDFVILD